MQVQVDGRDTLERCLYEMRNIFPLMLEETHPVIHLFSNLQNLGSLEV